MLADTLGARPSEGFIFLQGSLWGDGAGTVENTVGSSTES